MLWLLLALNVSVAILFVARSSISSDGVEVGHGLLFTAGFLFYWILPIGLGEVRAFGGVPVMRFWYRAYDAVPERALGGFLVLSFIYYVAFFAGSGLVARTLGRRSLRRERREILAFSAHLIDTFLLPATMVAAVLIFSLRQSLFRGYNVANIDVRARGPLVAISLVILGLAFLYALSRTDVLARGFFASIRNRYFAVYFVVAFLILTMGGRLYFVSSLLMLLVFRTVYFKKVRVWRLALVIFAVIAASGVAGILRFGGGASGMRVLLNIGAEPLFTSFSLLGFLRDARLPPLNTPVLLLNSVVNLLPRFVYPAKDALMLTPEDLGYNILAPVGALNSFVSFVINFGTVGTVAVLFSVGAFLGWLRTEAGEALPGTVYVMLSGWLAFTFFRDPFYVSLIKVMFQNSVVIPCIVVVALHVATVAARKERRFVASSSVPDEGISTHGPVVE